MKLGPLAARRTLEEQIIIWLAQYLVEATRPAPAPRDKAGPTDV
jgi:hypothetical protein